MNVFSLNKQQALKESVTNRQVLYFPNDYKTLIVNGSEYDGMLKEDKDKLESLLIADITIEDSKITVSYVDGSKKSFYTSAKIVSITYEDPVISLSYNDVPREGGKIYPNLSYSQLKTVNYADGTSEQIYITSGANIVYQGAESDGSVIVSSAVTARRAKVKTVDVELTLNGKTVNKTVDIYQWGELPKPDEGTIYYGLIPTNIMPDKLSEVILSYIGTLNSINTSEISHEVYKLLADSTELSSGNFYAILIPTRSAEKAKVWNGISEFVDFDIPDGQDSNLYFWGNKTLEYNSDIYRIYGQNLITTGITNYALIEN